jgi:hypothetical protein
MTDGLDQAVANAGLALLLADGGLVTFDGAVPNPTPTPPYCVAFTTISRPRDNPNNAIDGRSRTWVARVIVLSVGSTAIAVRAVRQRVRTQLLDVRPTIAGFAATAVGPFEMEGDEGVPQPNEITGGLVMEATDTYRFTATN